MKKGSENTVMKATSSKEVMSGQLKVTVNHFILQLLSMAKVLFVYMRVHFLRVCCVMSLRKHCTK
jgi:hypothetical protein